MTTTGPATGSGRGPGRGLIRLLNAIAAVRFAPGDLAARRGRARGLLEGAGLSADEANRLAILIAEDNDDEGSTTSDLPGDR